MVQQKAERGIGQDILDAALGDYKQQGFRLYACDREVLALDYKDKALRTFSNVATIVSIQKACQLYLNTGRAW